MKALREAKAWAVMNAAGDVISDSVRRTRVASIQSLTGPDDDMGSWRRRWRYWRGLGCRCVRVRLLPEGEG